MQKLIEKNPIGFSWFILLIQIFLGMGFFLFYKPFNFSEKIFGDFRNYDIYNLIYTIISIIIVAILGWWQETGFIRVEKWRHYLLFIPPLIFSFLILLPGISPSAAVENFSIKSIAFYLTLAIREEVFNRGLIQYSISKRGEISAVFASAVFFGLIHTSNLFVGQASIFITILQVARATAFGVGFGALRLRTRSIFPLIILHTVINIFTFTTVSSLSDTNWFINSWFFNLPSIIRWVAVFEIPAYLFGMYGLLLLLYIYVKKEKAESQEKDKVLQ